MAPEKIRKIVDELCVHHMNKVNSELGKNLSFKVIYRNFVCGRYSGLPYCCIFFYCFIWSPLFLLFSYSLVKKFIYWYPNREKYFYVPCPLCLLLNKRVNIKYCDYKTDKNCCVYKKNPTNTI